MQLAYRCLNVVLLFAGILFAMFLSWAGIGTREGLKEAVEANPFGVFFARIALAMVGLSVYSGLVFNLNRTVFRQVSHPMKIFRASITLYSAVALIFVYLFVRIR